MARTRIRSTARGSGARTSTSGSRRRTRATGSTTAKVYILENLPTWKAGRAALIAEQAKALQAANDLAVDPTNAGLQLANNEAICAYKQALDRFNSVDGAMNYRLDVMNDLRYYRKAVGLE